MSSEIIHGGWDLEIERSTHVLYSTLVDLEIAKRGNLLPATFFSYEEGLAYAHERIIRAYYPYQDTILSQLGLLPKSSQLLFFEAMVFDLETAIHNPDLLLDQAEGLFKFWQRDPQSIIPILRSAPAKALADIDWKGLYDWLYHS
jgi:hypothetical protein